MDIESITAQKLMDIAEFIYLGIDTSEKITLINRKGCEIFGYTEEEMIDKNYFENFLPAKIIKEMKKIFSKRIRDGSTTKTINVNPILTKSGEQRIIGWQNSYLRDENGKITGLLSTGFDLTENTRLEKELKEREEMLRSIIDNSPYGFVASKGEGNIVITNPTLEKMLDYSHEELKDLSMIGVTHPEDKEMSKTISGQVTAKKQQTAEYEKRYLRKDGSILEARTSTWGTYDSNGNLIYNFGLIEDISEEKNLERSRLEQEEMLRTEIDKSQNYLDIANVIILALDVQGKVSMINKKGCDLIGLELEEIVGKAWIKNFIPETLRKEVSSYFEKLMSGEIIQYSNAENSILVKNGEERLITWNNTLLKDEEGKIIGTLSSGTDITEQRYAEMVLKDNERLLSSTFNNTFTLQGIFDSEGRVIRVNQTALDFAGIEQSVIVDKYLWETYWWSHSDEEKEKLKNLFLHAKTGETALDIITNINAKKEIKYLFTSIRPIFDEDGSVKYVIVEGYDITDLKNAEESIKHSEIRFRSIFDNSSDGYLLRSAEGDVLNMNPKMLKMFGYCEDEIPRTIFDFNPFENPEILVETIEEVDKTGYVDIETIGLRKDGSNFPVEVKSIKLNILGEVIIFVVMRDISQRKENEEKLKSSEAMYRALFENTGTGIMLIEEDNTIALANTRLLEITGYTQDDSIGRKWTKFLPKEEIEGVRNFVNRWEGSSDQIITLETIYLNNLGEERNIVLTLGKVPNSTQRIVSLIDITIEKKLEKIMIESEERLRNLVENVPIAIAIMSSEGEILEINQAHWQKLGYDTLEDFLQTEPDEHWINLKDRDRLYSLLKKRRNINNFETKLRKKDGTIFWGSISAISHKDISGDEVSYQIIKDITTQKNIENALRQQIMKYKLEEANLYMVEEEFAYVSTEIFADLLTVGYEGIIFSRTAESKWKEEIHQQFKYFKLAEKGRGKVIAPNLETIEAKIEELTSRQIILLDRLDYLIQKNGFESTLFFIYRLMDAAFLANHIILLSIDSSTLNNQEKKLLSKELKHIEQKEEKLIPEDLFEVLMMVFQKNVSGAKPTISDIIDELSISRPTARKRIQGLIDDGFVTETTKGRTKVLQVTLKGKSMF